MKATVREVINQLVEKTYKLIAFKKESVVTIDRLFFENTDLRTKLQIALNEKEFALTAKNEADMIAASATANDGEQEAKIAQLQNQYEEAINEINNTRSILENQSQLIQSLVEQIKSEEIQDDEVTQTINKVLEEVNEPVAE